MTKIKTIGFLWLFAHILNNKENYLGIRSICWTRKSELSMIEVARAILEERGRDHEMYFSDLVNEIQTTLKIRCRNS